MHCVIFLRWTWIWIEMSPHVGMSGIFSNRYLSRAAGAQELKPYQQAHKLTRMPSPLEWFSYLFACGNLLSGPHFELSTYLEYVERRGVWDPKKEPPIPSPLMAGLQRLCKASFCLVVYYASLPYFSPTTLEGAWFANQNFPMRCAIGVNTLCKTRAALCIVELRDYSMQACGHLASGR